MAMDLLKEEMDGDGSIFNRNQIKEEKQTLASATDFYFFKDTGVGPLLVKYTCVA